MCYRPTDVKQSGPMKCPLCGKLNKPHATVCARCGATEEEIIKALDEQAASDGAPKAPKGPVAPPAPAAPAAPAPPSVPKPPTV